MDCNFLKTTRQSFLPVVADKAQVQGGFVWQLFVAVRDISILIRLDGVLPEAGSNR